MPRWPTKPTPEPVVKVSVHKVPGRKTGVAPAIRKLKLRYPEMSDAAIARKVGCQQNNVTVVLRRFLGDTSPEQLQSFQENKADVYDSIQHRMLASITQEKIDKSPLQSIVLSSAILEDKARLVRGQATGINVTVLMDAVEAIRESERQRKPQPHTIVSD